MTMSAYRTPGEVAPTLTPEEEERFLRALRPVRWLNYLFAALWTSS